MAYDGFQRPTGIEWGNAGKTYGQVKFGDDSQQVVLFYTRSVFNAVKSQQAGSRQYENQNWVKMHPPGEKLNIIDRPVQDNDKIRFPHQWNSFLQNKTQVPEGTPIDLLFPNNPAVADNLKAFGVHTIQQCANLSANALETVGMGATEWKNMAVQYLQSASDGTAFLKLRAELDEERRAYKVLARQFEQLKAQYDQIMIRLNDPNARITENSFVADIAQETLNANHSSQSVRPSVKRGKRSEAPPKDEIDQANLIPKYDEQDFPTKDVTKE